MPGTCYRFALETFFDLYSIQQNVYVTAGSNHFAVEFDSAPGVKYLRNCNVPELGESPVLVHGYPYGQSGVVEGKKFGHAWLEGNGFVVDCGSVEKRHYLVTQEEYYELGRIDPKECHRYGIEEVAKLVVTTKRDGLWNEPPPDVLTGQGEDANTELSASIVPRASSDGRFATSLD